MDEHGSARNRVAESDAQTIALELARASGVGLARGKILIPTPRLVWLARRALAKAKVVESLEMVPGDGDVRLHLVLKMMGNSTRVAVRAAVATLHLAKSGGALRLRLLEPPSFAGKSGGKSGGVLGMLGAFGEAALTSMGPRGIVQTVAEFMGPPLSAHGDLLMLDLGAIPAVKKLVRRPTPVGEVGDLLHVTGAHFRPGGLEVAVRLRPRAAVNAIADRLMGNGG